MASANKCKILVVDDDTSLRDMLAELPALVQDFVVVTADTAVGLAERITAEQPDVVLLDVMMPGVSGCMAVARLRQLGFKTKIIVYTGLDATVLEPWAKKMGADDFIAKPFDLDVLEMVIRRNCKG